ncbi:unnamed protein product [Tilletia controversa]|uniref:Uncharacterized protein n=1 Tax=Tilletia controversa TaxID=13291 RepID=A0A8X7SUC1_9BASI|nr:hypothetical protein A4X06_0g6760 [Tilletia controversa]CAD6913427.1 unnamed protein product [Tilletia controversa]CAD6973368.1 unnamed protein product [Tilletia controversa]
MEGIGYVLAADPAQILLNRGGRVVFLVLWPFICSVAAFVCITAIQASPSAGFSSPSSPLLRTLLSINRKTGNVATKVKMDVHLTVRERTMEIYGCA